MNDYVIVTDSCCDLTEALAKKAELTVIPMVLNISGTEYHNYLDEREIGSKDFYARLRSGENASTSAVNMDVFTSVFEEILNKGKDVLYLGFSSGLSSTYHVSTLVAEELSKKYPENKIYCVDTLAASMGEGLLVYCNAKAIRQDNRRSP